MTQTLFPEKSESQPKIYAYQELYNLLLQFLIYHNFRRCIKNSVIWVMMVSDFICNFVPET